MTGCVAVALGGRVGLEKGNERRGGRLEGGGMEAGWRGEGRRRGLEEMRLDERRRLVG